MRFAVGENDRTLRNLYFDMFHCLMVCEVMQEDTTDALFPY
jgi:hypothetical protein